MAFADVTLEIVGSGEPSPAEALVPLHLPPPAGSYDHVALVGIWLPLRS